MADTHFVIAIRNKIPVLVSGPPCIVTDNSDYTVTFEPDAEWDGFEAKTVYYAFDTGGAIVHPIVGNEDAVPIMTKARMVYIGVSAGDLRTTKALGIRVQPSVRQMAGVQVPEPESDVYDRIMELINQLPDALYAAENAQKAADSAAESEAGAAAFASNAEEFAKASAESAGNAAKSADLAEQVAVNNGFAEFYMENGRIHLVRTTNIVDKLDFNLVDGRLVVNIHG